MAPRLSIDRVAELALLGLAVAIAWQLASPAHRGAEAGAAPLASLRPSLPPPAAELDRVRRLVDGNDPGARGAVAALTGGSPASPEAWALAARFHEQAGEAGAAVAGWARAVRLDPSLADEDSPGYMGKRIGALAEGELLRLREAKRQRELTPAEKEELDGIYYLRRRLAGGCE